MLVVADQNVDDVPFLYKHVLAFASKAHVIYIFPNDRVPKMSLMIESQKCKVIGDVTKNPFHRNS